MQDHAAISKHWVTEPDPSKNPHKYEKLRERCARLETQIDVAQHDAVTQVVRLMGADVAAGRIGVMDTAEFYALLELASDDQRQKLLRHCNPSTLVGFLKDMHPDRRKKVVSMLHPEQVAMVSREIPGMERGNREKQDKASHEDVIAKLWQGVSGMPAQRRSRWHSSADQMMDALEASNGQALPIDKSIGEIIAGVRAMKEILANKRKRLEQLGPSRRKKTLQRIRLLRSSAHENKQSEAARMSQELATRDEWEKGRDALERLRRRARERAAERGPSQERGFVSLRANWASSADIRQFGERWSDPANEELFGGVEHVPVQYRKWERTQI